MKALILDEDVFTTNEIINHCESSSKYISTIHSAKSFQEATTLHERYIYDIIFMGLEFSQDKGIKALNAKNFNNAEVILLSSEKDFLIDAYKFNISDYLTKPIQFDQFDLASKKIYKKRTTGEEQYDGQEHLHLKEMIEKGKFNRIALTTLDGYTIVHYDDIIRCEANGNYTSVYFMDGSFLMLTRTLKHYDSILSEKGFFRTHKTHLVNMKYIRSYIKGKSSYVELLDGTQIEVSSRKKKLLRL